jgi:Tfp pilus assembly protein PilN
VVPGPHFRAAGRNQCCKSEITRLEGQIKDIASLESEIAALRARQQAVEDLQADRNVPVHLLTEMVASSCRTASTSRACASSTRS